jgi:DNA-binding LacI/PurR family transcriptional regulator
VVEYYPADQTEADFQPPHQVAGRLVDGSLVIGDVGDRLRHWLDDQTQYPWVSMLEQAKFCVLSAEHRTTYAALKELIKLGHRRIACPTGEVKHLSHRLRLAAFRHAVRHFKLTIPNKWQIFLSEDSAQRYQWAHQILKLKNRPTAIVCQGDAMARIVILVAAELGLRVPRDLSVISYSSPEVAHAGYPCLAGIHTNWAALTEAAVDLLKQRINGVDDQISEPHRWILPYRFDGQSVAPPNGG